LSSSSGNRLDVHGLGHGLAEHLELERHLAAEPVGVADGVRGLPADELAVGEQDRRLELVGVGDRGQRVHVERLAGVVERPAALALLQLRLAFGARVHEPAQRVAGLALELDLGDRVAVDVAQVDEVHVVLAAVGDRRDDRAEPERALGVDVALPGAALGEVGRDLVVASDRSGPDRGRDVDGGNAGAEELVEQCGA